ncbi:enoyl-CoA hydratase/isomerase family protein [Desulfobacterium sp. N47]|uniref:3-hydroxybutyryl-CoA dehydratase n=2 Tax=Bacteria TaxID=2 RepID=E1YKJ2_9BACT
MEGKVEKNMEETTASTEVVLLSKREHVAVVTLNRPEAMNSLNGAVFSRLKKIIDELEADDEIRAIIITGAGDKAFCAGIDLRERKGMSSREVNSLRNDIIFPCFRSLEDMKKPLIGAINGLSLGGGAEIALMCDIRVASDNARFGQTEVKWAIIPAAGACQRLPALIGLGRAKELLLTGRIIDAAEGEKIGLFNFVTPSAALLQKAYEVADMIGENGPVAVRQIKKAVDLGAKNNLALAFDSEASEACYHTQDRLEGITAFNEKRKPKYNGM